MFKAGVVVAVSLVVMLVAGGLFESADNRALASEDEIMNVPMGSLVLEAPEGVDAKRSAVEFPHGVHFGFNCMTCHHKWEPPEQIASCTTSGCHDVFKLAENKEKMADSELSVKFYRSAYHNLCIGCHKSIKTKDWKMEMSGRIIKGKLSKTGPTGCIQCHPKEG